MKNKKVHEKGKKLCLCNTLSNEWGKDNLKYFLKNKCLHGINWEYFF